MTFDPLHKETDEIELEAAALRRFLQAQEKHLQAWLEWRECSGCADASPAYERWAFGEMLGAAALAVREVEANENENEANSQEPLKALPAPISEDEHKPGADLFAKQGDGDG